MVEAAPQNPERFGHLVAEMDRTGKVNGAFRKLRMANDEERVKALAPIARRFRTLVVDPPWAYELSLVGQAAPRAKCDKLAMQDDRPLPFELPAAALK